MANYIDLPLNTSVVGGDLSGSLPNPQVTNTNLPNASLNFTKLAFTKVITPIATIGSATINALAGTVNFDTAMASLVVTNNTVGTGSIVLAVLRTADADATLKNVVPASGSFTITLGAAAAAPTSCGFLVIG